jgi:phosphoglycerate dehydrogenase-like enzyme
MLPPKQDLTICFAHVAYQLAAQFAKRERGIPHFQVWNREDLEARVGEADVLVVSGLWRNDLLESAGRLQFIQSVGAGTDQFAREQLARRGIRLASARGVNSNAVSDHAMALLLALARKLPEARDNQAKRHWRGMISDLDRREDELPGKTLFVVGIGAIGDRLARLAKAFGMEVRGFRKTPAQGPGGADSVHAIGELTELLPSADFVALTCPLTAETRHLINAAALKRMKPSAYLINVARGPCVDEVALARALSEGRIAGAAGRLAALDRAERAHHAAHGRRDAPL